MSTAPTRAMVSHEAYLMRLAKRLLKILTVLALAAAALGGAAALGSTLFQAPPRDAVEFAQRVEAGSTYWEDVAERERAAKGRRKPARGWKDRPRAEARYLRSLDRLCTRERNTIDRLPTPKKRRETLTYLRRWLRVTRAHQKKARALDEPARLKRRMEQYLRLWEGSERNVVKLRKALQQKESFLVLLVMDELDGVGGQANALADKLGFTSCVVDDFPEV